MQSTSINNPAERPSGQAYSAIVAGVNATDRIYAFSEAGQAGGIASEVVRLCKNPTSQVIAMSTTEEPSTVVSLGEAVLERMVIAVERVRERLRRSTAALEQAGIPYAVIGGNAVAAWVSKVDLAAARNMVGVDLLVRREDFEAVKVALGSVGFEYSFTFGVQLFVDGPQGKAREGVHVLFANEKVKDEYSILTPDITAATQDETFRVINFDQLLVMKLTAFRRKDQVHIQDMIEVGLIDRTWLNKVPDSLRPRLQELLDDPNG
jgi:hypothetical protein